jgi:arsenite methyltransferase
LAIADLWKTRQHAEYPQEQDWPHAERRSVGRRKWYGGPWISTHLVTATKPG